MNGIFRNPMSILILILIIARSGRIANFMTNPVSAIVGILVILPGMLIALSFHEFAHAYAAVKLGDDTPRLQGRLSVDPLRHIDPIGFLCLMFIGFGWAKPVVINPRNFENPRRDDTIVAFAGPLMNFVLAIVFMGILKLLFTFAPYNFLASQTGDILVEILLNTVSINLVLMVFNLIPIPPLDGHHILGNIGGAKVWNFYHDRYELVRAILILLLITGGISMILSPMVNGLYRFIYGIFF